MPAGTEISELTDNSKKINHDPLMCGGLLIDAVSSYVIQPDDGVRAPLFPSRVDRCPFKA